jgi:hypothetical protein
VAFELNSVQLVEPGLVEPRVTTHEMWPVVATLVDLVEPREKTTAVFALRFQMKGHDIGNEEGITRGGVLVGAEAADVMGDERTCNLRSTPEDQLKIGDCCAVRVVLVDALPWLEFPFQFLDDWSLLLVLLDVQSVHRTFAASTRAR